MTAFSTLNVLPPAQLTNLNELGYLTMTPVQAAALPAILAGKDVRVQAKTGSGKTAAFGLGLLQQIDASLFQTQALVLCPTRELADQVAGELRRLARFLPNTKILTLCGGQPFGMQRDSLQHAPHIIVATPGRLLDHLQKDIAPEQHQKAADNKGCGKPHPPAKQRLFLLKIFQGDWTFHRRRASKLARF